MESSLRLFGLILISVVAVRRVDAQNPTAQSTGEAWQIVPLTQSSRVLARDGSLIGDIGREIRNSIPLKSFPWFVS
jgi:penicillin-binding protein 1A